MTSFSIQYTASTLAQLALALGLLTLGLPRRERFLRRAAMVALLATGGTAFAVRLGFELFPALSDLGSFVRAIGSFALVCAALVAATLALFRVSATSALYYASSAYLLQTLTSTVHRTLVGTIAPVPADGPQTLSQGWFWGITALVYGIAYLVVVRRLVRAVVEVPRTPALAFALALSLAVSLVFDLLVKDVTTTLPQHYGMVLSLFDVGFCAFVLVAEYEIIFGQVMWSRTAIMEHAITEQRRQFELSRSTIDSINRRCHDMRHQVFRIIEEGGTEGALSREQLAQIAREMNVYDTAVRTGCPALDVVITEKGLLARQGGGSIACIADGDALSGIASADVYALFGGLLDAALAATARIADPELRTITLDLRSRMGMAHAAVEYDVPDKGTAVDDDALAGARGVTERLGGQLFSGVRDGVVHLGVILPIP